MIRQLVEVVLISGVTLGSVYAVLALGLTIVYGVSKVFNMAYGSYFTWGAYLAWVLGVGVLHLSYFLVFPILVVILFGLGFLTEKALIQPIRRRADWQSMSIFLTLGLALFLDNLALVIFGPFVKTIPPLISGTVRVGGLAIDRNMISTLAFAVLLVVLIELFLGRSRLGMAIRAISQDETGARIVGIPLDRYFGYSFGLSIVLVGITGILVAPMYYISPLGGWNPFIKSFVVVAFGGLGSIKGALYSAFILGILEALVTWQLGGVWIMVFWFLVLLAVLIVRPAGLAGKWG